MNLVKNLPNLNPKPLADILFHRDKRVETFLALPIKDHL